MVMCVAKMAVAEHSSANPPFAFANGNIGDELNTRLDRIESLTTNARTKAVEALMKDDDICQEAKDKLLADDDVCQEKKNELMADDNFLQEAKEEEEVVIGDVQEAKAKAK